VTTVAVIPTGGSPICGELVNGAPFVNGVAQLPMPRHLADSDPSIVMLVVGLEQGHSALPLCHFARFGRPTSEDTTKLGV
jgi:hypothetical protein